MFDVLDRQTTLTGNQKKIIAAAIIGDALEFFDYFLIGFVLAFVIGPWKLTFGQSAIVLLSSGVGAIIGAYVWGWIADRIGRRKVFIGTVLNFSIATGLLYFTPDNGWIYLTVMRFFVGCRRRRPLLRRPAAGPGVHADLQARLGRRTGHLRHPARRRPRRRAGRLHADADQWRLLFAIGLLPALVVLLVRLWVPESPHWLARQGRFEEARKSLAWALQVDARVAAPARRGDVERRARQDQLVRSVQVSAQPAGVVARQCRGADRRLWRRALGAGAVRAAAEGDAAGSRQDDDPADRHRLHRAPRPSPGSPRRSGGATRAACWASAPAS